MDVTKTLRRWDDWGKLHGVEGPGLDAYRQVVLDHLLSSRIQARSTPGKLHSSIPQMRECSRRRPPSMGKSTRSKTPSNLCRQQRDQSEGPHPRFHQQPARLQKNGGQIQRRLERLEWLCFDDNCNRLDALSCSSTLVSFFTRVQVSCADISPSCSHLMLDNSAGDIQGRRGFST